MMQARPDGRPQGEEKSEPSGGKFDRSVLDAVTRLLDGELGFETYAQPVVDLHRGAIVGYEALTRFSAIGLPPDKVLYAAQSLGRRLDLESLLAEQAISLRSSLPPNCFLSLNVGPGFLLSPKWPEMAAKYQNFSGLVIEVTEQEAIRDYTAMRREISVLRGLGGTLAIDDTGSGFASLKHVIELRPDFIKLDRLFIDGCHMEPAKRAMIELLGDAADRLDSWIIAEGIETRSELDELLRMHVPLGQGYFLGRPAQGFAALDPAAAEALRVSQDEFVHTRTLMRCTEMCSFRSSAEEARHRMISDPAMTHIVVVDSWGRPADILERHPVAGIRLVRAPMRVQAASTPEEVLRRALTRTPEQTFDPLLVINEQGRLVGIARLDRLMRLVLEAGGRAGDVPVLAHPYSPDRLHLSRSETQPS